MKKTARAASTQNFTEIVDIADNVVVFTGGNASLIIEVTATNFALQSDREQMTKIISYGSLLNSLSFPIQIIIRSKRLDISSYLKNLDTEAQRTPNKVFSEQIQKYRNFVTELVKNNSVLDKRFYIAIPFSFLEKGPSSAIPSKKEDLLKEAKIILHSKAENLLTELSRIGLKAKILGKEELISLFHDIYNGDETKAQHLSKEGERPVLTK